MKATGMVRRLDDLGRVAIPKEVRRMLNLRDGDPLEVFVDRDGMVILKKYSPLGDLGNFANEYADALHESTGHVAIITDRDTVVAVSGGPKKTYLNKPVTRMAESIMQKRAPIIDSAPCMALVEGASFMAQVIAPIVCGGDPIGSVILASHDGDARLGYTEAKIAETAASFLSKQME